MADKQIKDFTDLENASDGDLLLIQQSDNTYKKSSVGNIRNQSSIQSVNPLSGDTVVSNGSRYLYINNDINIALLTITMPSSPKNGQKVSFISKNNITSLTLSGATIINTVSNLLAGVNSTFIYIIDSWVKI